MTYSVVLSQAARTDLEAATAWYRERSGSAEISDNWYAGFVVAIQSLERTPERCGISRESEEFSIELRELLYGSGRRKTHRAVFTVIGNRVEVLAIRHVAQRDLRPSDL